jgi:hypothetical protein
MMLFESIKHHTNLENKNIGLIIRIQEMENQS